MMCAMAVPRLKLGSSDGLKGFFLHLVKKLFLVAVAAAALLVPNTCSAAASGE